MRGWAWLLSATHALAKTDRRPRQLIQALDADVADLDVPDQLVTCCHLVIAPDAGSVAIDSGRLWAGALVVTGSGNRGVIAHRAAAARASR